MRLVVTGDRHRAFQLPGDPTEGAARYRRRNGWNTRFVPADTGVDDGCACRLDGLCQQLLPAAYCRR